MGGKERGIKGWTVVKVASVEGLGVSDLLEKSGGLFGHVNLKVDVCEPEDGYENCKPGSTCYLGNQV